MVYFAGKRVDNHSVEDRLGTAVVQGGTTRRAYYPYGELRGDPATGLQFATYQRDSITNLDYAQQRSYSSQIGRFLTVDPAPADPAEPQSWNRYNYVGGDPANQVDPNGLTPIYGPIGRNGGSLLCMQDLMMGDDWRRPPGMSCSPIPGTESGPMKPWRTSYPECNPTGNPVMEKYDSLGRLIDAHTTGNQWGQTFAYDGFGNLTAETQIATKLAGPSVTRTYNAATNQLTPYYTYDNNGNMTAMPGLGMTYNVENRLTQATSNLNGTESYGYDAAGLRLWKQGPDSVTHVYYNGPGGKPLADFYLSGGSMAGGTPMVYFAGKRVDNQSVEDRLGTAVVQNGQARQFFPYGELRSAPVTDVQFATYKRDATTNLNYAQQRLYANQVGRFLTPDPYPGSASAEIPESWNRYLYVGNDPTGRSDPTGECDVVIAGINQRNTNSPDVEAFAETNGAISVYPYVANSDTGSLLGFLGSTALNLIQIAGETFGANSSTLSAVEGLLEAAQDGTPINVTTYSGGAESFTSAVSFLNSHGASNVTDMINNITYIAPGSAEPLYNNGNVLWIGGGLANGIVGIDTSIPQKPAAPTVENLQCGHDFHCLVTKSKLISGRSGQACSNPVSINQPTADYQADYLHQRTLWLLRHAHDPYRFRDLLSNMYGDYYGHQDE